ncbi:uncharacterized protein LOC121416869 [Lytechinus variegatus]|uniref:uncharacterized protein LOC121416869 n=1 Tax=Lytechinus variegatus TaxID=7654 RepID=UPI001BB1E01D|nr:uncharacterized protein LOC121416869 [Lytechinus variegatus]XP_041466324.1 uncharacterized protein LOC121416869 [Lytechinus variegatus]
MSPGRDGTPSVTSLKDQRLSVYCSPRFCRRSRYLEKACVNSMLEKKDDFGWQRAFNPRFSSKGPSSSTRKDGKRAISANGASPPFQCQRRKFTSQSTLSHLSSSDTDSLGCANLMANLDLSSPKITTNDAGAEEDDPSAPGTPTLLPKRQKQRPASLALLDNHASQSLDSNANGEHLGSACCSLHVRKDRAADRSPAGSARAIPTSSKGLNPPSYNPLSKSCSDLRGGTIDECCMIHRNFSCRCPSHLSLQSARVSTPSDSHTGSRISLLSEGVDSYEGLYEKAYRATYVMDRDRLVNESKVSPDRLVREWLARQEEVTQNTPEQQEVKQ